MGEGGKPALDNNGNKLSCKIIHTPTPHHRPLGESPHRPPHQNKRERAANYKLPKAHPRELHGHGDGPGRSPALSSARLMASDNSTPTTPPQQ